MSSGLSCNEDRQDQNRRASHYILALKAKQVITAQMSVLLVGLTEIILGMFQ